MTEPALAGGASQGPSLTVDLWADVICPFCYLAGAQLAQALAAEDLEPAQVRLRVHSYELDPDAPDRAGTTIGALAQKYGMSEDQARGAEQRNRDAARGLGLTYVTERPIGSTLPVHRLVQAARRSGRATAFLFAVQGAYFSGRLDPFDLEALTAFATGVGLTPDEVNLALTDDDHEQAVRADEAAAAQLGVSSVPFHLLNGQLAVAGAVGVEDFRAAIREAREETPAV